MPHVSGWPETSGNVMGAVDVMCAGEHPAVRRATVPIWAQYGLAADCGMAGSAALLFAGLPIPPAWWFTLGSLVFWTLVCLSLLLHLPMQCRRGRGTGPGFPRGLLRQ